MKTGKAPFCKLFSNKVTNEEQSSSGLGISVQPKVLSGNPCKKQELRRPRLEASSPGGCRNAAFPLQPLGNQGRMRGTYTWGNIYHAEPTQHPPWPQIAPVAAADCSLFFAAGNSLSPFVTGCFAPEVTEGYSRTDDNRQRRIRAGHSVRG